MSLSELTQASVMLFTASEVITHTVLSETTTETVAGEEDNSQKPGSPEIWVKVRSSGVQASACRQAKPALPNTTRLSQS